jgi:hypothetical protein
MEGGQRANDVPARALTLELMWRSVRWSAAESLAKPLSSRSSVYRSRIGAPRSRRTKNASE